MLARPDHTSALTLTGFTEAQAGALTTAIDHSATRAVDDLRHDLEIIKTVAGEKKCEPPK